MFLNKKQLSECEMHKRNLRLIAIEQSFVRFPINHAWSNINDFMCTRICLNKKIIECIVFWQKIICVQFVGYRCQCRYDHLDISLFANVHQVHKVIAHLNEIASMQ